MAQLKLTADILAAALEGLEVQKQRLDTRISEIRQMLDGVRTEATTTAAATGKPKRKVSAAARRRMAQAQKVRWMKVKQGLEPSQPAKLKRTMSASARKKIAAAQKRRWKEKKRQAA